jgi:pectate lyase
MKAPPPRTQTFVRSHTLGFGLRLILLEVSAFGTTCSVQNSELVKSNGNAGATGPIAELFGDAATAVATAVDARPIGGASLGSGTQGGGTLSDAQARGQLHVVGNAADILATVSGDVPAVILIREGTYDFALSPGRTSKACSVPCTPTTPVATETLASSSCPSSATLTDTFSTYDTARVGDNKTIIGLGAGATLKNLKVDLSGSSNVILRNLAFVDVNPGIFHDGEAVQMMPANHVWVDHCTFRNISYTSLHISSDYDETNNQALTAVAGYVTISFNHFDGRTNKACGGQDPTVMSGNRNPGVTLHHNWFDTTDNWNPYVIGPGMWAHLFNNVWSNVSSISVGVTCGAVAILEGNTFENARDAVYLTDSGAPTWAFCQAGLFGDAYLPTASADEEQNLLDSNSPLSLNGQEIDGTGLSLPSKRNGHTFRITVPASPLGDAAASYDYELEATPTSLPTLVKASTGIGHLF